VLTREGFDEDAHKVVAALSRLLDPNLIRGGQTYAVRVDDQGEPEAVECAMKRGSGNAVVLSHGNGMATRY
jgi:hypothetical protein